MVEILGNKQRDKLSSAQNPLGAFLHSFPGKLPTCYGLVGNTNCLDMSVCLSVTQVIAYIMKEFSWPLDRTLKFVQRRRPCVKPNPGFLKQLFEYEGILNAKLVEDSSSCCDNFCNSNDLCCSGFPPLTSLKVLESSGIFFH